MQAKSKSKIVPTLQDTCLLSFSNLVIVTNLQPYFMKIFVSQKFLEVNTNQENL